MSRIAIVGAHGKVAQQLMRVLYDRGDDFVGLVRADEHAEDVYRLGGEGVLLDIERADVDAIAEAFAGCDAVVFTAGAGAGSGIERKRTVDYEGSVKSAEAAAKAGIRRFVQVSAWGVDSPVADDASDVWRAYVEAKRDADAALRATDLDWTIIRPGRLTDDPATGLVDLGPDVARGDVTRADVAAVVAAVIGVDASIHRQWNLVNGSVPVAEAVRRG